MRLKRSSWFQYVFGAGLVAGCPRALRAVAHCALFVADAYLFQLFAVRSAETAAFAPVAAFFLVRMLVSAALFIPGVFRCIHAWFADAGGDVPMVAIIESVRAEAEGREP